jgi:hypothetical protein
VALREEEKGQRMIQDATVSREEERIPSLLHTKTSGRRREAFAIRFSRHGDTQGGGEGAAALDNERPQGGGGSLSYSI